MTEEIQGAEECTYCGTTEALEWWKDMFGYCYCEDCYWDDQNAIMEAEGD